MVSEIVCKAQQSCGNWRVKLTLNEFHSFAERMNEHDIHKCRTNRLTQGELLPRIWRQREAEQRHRGDENTGHDEVEEIVQSPPPVGRNRRVCRIFNSEEKKFCI